MNVELRRKYDVVFCLHAMVNRPRILALNTAAPNITSGTLSFSQLLHLYLHLFVDVSLNGVLLSLLPLRLDMVAFTENLRPTR